MKSQPKHSWCKKSSSQELQKGQKDVKPNWPSAVDEIKIFDNDDKAVKRSFSLRMFCGLVIIIKNFNFINSRRPWPPNSFSYLFHPGLFLVLGHYFFYTRGVLVKIRLMGRRYTVLALFFTGLIFHKWRFFWTFVILLSQTR